MNTVNIAIAAFAAFILLAIGTAQTRGQTQPGQVGRYQLISTPFKWLGADSDNKAVIDETNRVFRIDTVTGDTSVLQFTTDQNRNVRTFWMPVGK